MKQDEAGRFPERLQSRILPEPNSGCWLFTGDIGHNGYGLIYWKGKTRRAHRLTYELSVGSIPIGSELDHLCGVRSCVNPAHLQAVTRRTNVLRGKNSNRGKTHCRNGHLLDSGNLYIDPAGIHKCRQCGRESRAKRTYHATQQA